jgi:SPP1 family predicted phage head-tail adaptor
MILNGKPVNPGELITDITLLSRTVSQDSSGAQTAGTSTIATVKCRWINAYGAEVWAAQAAQTVEPATVLMRYRSDVNQQCLVQKGSAIYEILSADDIRDQHEYIELKVSRVVNS